MSMLENIRPTGERNKKQPRNVIIPRLFFSMGTLTGASFK